VTPDDVQAWLDRYVEAWRANERAPIRALFTEDALYRYLPYEHPSAEVRGADAIATSWLEHQDEPETWEAHYFPWLVAGDQAVATGSSRYAASDTEPARTYHNVFLLRFAADGRCSEFRELYMLERSAEQAE
jgi:ketosteroid isomerase-like protein